MIEKNNSLEAENQVMLQLRARKRDDVLRDYIKHVANDGLLPYKAVLQHGGKRGQSYYMHVLDGVLLLEALRNPLKLTTLESRILFTAYTIHDINKAPGQSEAAFRKLATKENLSAEIKKVKLTNFFPEWADYIAEITTLVKEHGGSYHVGGSSLFAKPTVTYKLPAPRVKAMVQLMKAVDIVDLSHTLIERPKKDKFLSHLNTYLADSDRSEQYEFVTHHLTEQRGILTNLIHDGIRDHLHQKYNLLPLLYYPDGVAYLKERSQPYTLTADDITAMSKRIAASISKLTTAKFTEFINSTASGIKVDTKILELGIPFSEIWNEMYNLAMKRNFDAIELDTKIRTKAQREFDKAKKKNPKGSEQAQGALDTSDLLVSSDLDLLRLTELIRSYYIFLNKHFKKVVPDAWQRVYDLLELPPKQHDYYAYFDALFSRAYVLSKDLQLTEAEVFHRIEQDGRELTERDQAEDPKAALFGQYLNLYAVFGRAGRPAKQIKQQLAHYVSHQHKQCVHCSGPFSTNKWMTADVRSDIKVQSFSNRLRGGPGEPKKYICAVCQLQFMLEKLNYPEIRGEKTIYLHLYPYSYTTAPFIEAIQDTIRSFALEGEAVQAFNLNVRSSMTDYLSNKIAQPKFFKQTKKGKPQPYGLYLTRYPETIGNLIILPLNPSGNNDTDQFLFALWNALLLQRFFGMKVLLSNSPVAPLDTDHLPDVYIANIPLSCQGLLPHNDYPEYIEGDKAGALNILWNKVENLFALGKHTFTLDDPTPRLVRALRGNPLKIYYETEKLLEARTRGADQGGLQTYLFQQSIQHVEFLAKNNRGGTFMTDLSTELQQLAQLAWKNKLKGKTLVKNSLLFPVKEIFQKIRLLDDILDVDTIKAAAVQDIFDHLDRIADTYKPGRTKHNAIKDFVDGWFDNVLGKIYEGNPRRLLSDEKLLYSAYHFYIRQQITSKAEQETVPEVQGSD